MPLIKLTQEALDRGKLPEVGWSPAILNDITEFPSADKKSTNYSFEFLCTGGPENKTDNENRYQNILFNSKALGMDSKGVPKALDMFTRMLAALQGVSVREVSADEYNTDALKGKHCWIKIAPDTDLNGKLILAIVDFAADADVPF